MNEIQWWCSARTGQLWTWSFQAYPGIWLFMLAGLAAYVLAVRRHRRRSPGPALRRSELVSFAIGFLLLWAVLDWPVGPLAAGYLLSAHMLQYLLITLIIAPLLDAGMPEWMLRGLVARRGMGWLRAALARPSFCFAWLNGVMIVTHLPAVADALKPRQFGAMAMDLLWIGSALLFWWSIRTDGPEPERAGRFGKRLLYLAGVKLAPIFLGAFLVFAEFPLYRTFELATRALPLDALDDQLLAGLFMWMGTTPILLYRLTTAWFSWVSFELGSVTPRTPRV